MTGNDFARLERQIARVLRFGVALSATALAAGLAMWWRSMPGSRYLFDAGLLLLMAIPVTRILASMVDAARRKDRLLVWSTIYVLIVMAVTFVTSRWAGR